MKKVLLLLIPFWLVTNGFAQGLKVRDTYGGMFSFGIRTTASTFNAHANERSALGIGGHYRIRVSNRVNTEWFADYLPATNEFTRREDYHIGWSVMFYLRNKPAPKLQPYVLAGHCFDYTHHVELADRTNQIKRWSSAIQAGLGAHYNLTERFDISLTSQYMFHMGTDVHSEVHFGTVDFHKEKGGIMEGHLLFTLSANYVIGDLWGGK